MSEFPDPDFTTLRGSATVRRFSSRLEDVEHTGAAESRAAAGEATGDGHTHNVDHLAAVQQETGHAAQQNAASAAAADKAAQLASQWESAAPKDAEIDAADDAKERAVNAMVAAEKFGTPAEVVSTVAAATAATQHAQVLRAQRIAADEAYTSGMAALTAKVEQQTVASQTFAEGYRPTPPTNALGALKPPAPRIPGTGTPAAPRTPSAPGAPTAPRTQLAKAEMPTMPQVPQGQAQPQQSQAQQQPHPQAGGAPTGTPTAKATDKKRDGTDSAPTGLAAAVGATGAGASPVPSAATTPRPTNPGYSRDGMVTGTNVSGRPAPQVSLSAGMPTTAPATAAGTAAAPGTGGMPYGPGAGGIGGKGAGAGRETKTIAAAAPEPLEDGIVRGGTVCRGDETPEQRAS
ncbi:hypothetical protein C5U48_02605 [Mycolicibacter virginiensis]|uniref:Uncharacterized protein n=1 Tax=Mycolicibacter virginiensis TaxID=1795032 RepID=A0A9X7IR54_9MYCO|nr:hypothetical protein [Mycolicibacter virginiensis]PQM53720.1 hypothetical protein C5U48_02605 [Mycolicibacter virginiensis]